MEVIKSEKMPEFNSGIAYLNRLHNLTVQFENCIITNQYKNAANILRLLHAEVRARASKINHKEMIINMDNAKDVAENALADDNLDSKQVMVFVLEWNDILQEKIHVLGLSMPDKANSLSGADS
jgi:hypothetical protein